MSNLKSNLNDPLDEIDNLVESSLPLIGQTYRQALQDGQTDPVVILVDCEDSVGGEIVRAWVGDEAVDDALLAQSDEPDEATTVFARAVPGEVATRQVPDVFPYLKGEIQASTHDHVSVVAIGGGGAAAYSCPTEELDA